MPGQRLQQVSINIAASGDNTVLAALTSGEANKIRVIHSLELVNTSNSDTTVIYKSGATALNGAGYLLHAGDQDNFDSGNPNETAATIYRRGWIIGPGAAFIINLDGANQHSGKAFYTTEVH